MTVFDVFAGMWMLAGDVFVVFGLVGSILFFLTTLFKRNPRSLPESVWQWAIVGNVLAIICLGSLFVTDNPTRSIGIVWSMSTSVGASLVAISVLLLLESLLLRQRQKTRLRKG
jgi:hypothetical protein